MKCRQCGRGPEEGQGWGSLNGTGTEGRHDVCPERVCKELQKKNPGINWPTFKRCSKDGKGQNGEGQWLCGLHLSVYRRRLEREQGFKGQQDRSRENYERVQRMLTVLAQLQINGEAEYRPSSGSGAGRYTGRIVVDPQEILNSIDQAYKAIGPRKKSA